MSRASKTALSLILVLATGVFVTACGEDRSHLLPEQNVQELTASIDNVQQLVDDGQCFDALEATEPLQDQAESLPATVDPKLKRSLIDGVVTLITLVARQCEDDPSAVTGDTGPTDTETEVTPTGDTGVTDDEGPTGPTGKKDKPETETDTEVTPTGETGPTDEEGPTGPTGKKDNQETEEPTTPTKPTKPTKPETPKPEKNPPVTPTPPETTPPPEAGPGSGGISPNP